MDDKSNTLFKRFTGITAREVVGVVSLASMFTFSLLFYVIWGTAFLNGGKATVTINEYNEIWIEFLIFSTIPGVIAAAIYAGIVRIDSD